MYGLKNMLEQELLQLDSVIQIAQKQSMTFPKGTLRVSMSRNAPQFYHCHVGGTRNGIYIPVSEQELINKLAQKEYDEKLLQLALRRRKQISSLLTDYEDEELISLFHKEHPEKQKRISPILLPWDQFAQQWMEDDYTGLPFETGEDWSLTNAGEKVRSKSEKIIADYLFSVGIPYKYEKPLILKGYKTVYPDFRTLSHKYRREYIWEHLGLMDNPAYANRAIMKQRSYEKNGYFVGENMIITQETKDHPLSVEQVKLLVDRYLL